MLYLHIGRGKSGTSSIQAALMENADSLAAQGVIQPSGVERTFGNSVNIAKALRGDPDQIGALRELSRLTANPDARIVVSSEYLFDRSEEQLAMLREAIHGEVQVIAYVRAYPEWLRSLYGQAVRKGRCRVNFDSYLASTRDILSIRDQIQRWIKVFGRDSLRVRHVSSLRERGVVTDFADAVGVNLNPSRETNISPHWVEIELLRAMFLHEPRPPTLMGPEARLNVVKKLVRKGLQPHHVPDAVYLMKRDAERLDAQYRDDALWLWETTGTPEPPPRTAPLLDRPFLPSLAMVPAPALTTIRTRLAQAPLAANIQPYVQETLARVWDRVGVPAEAA